MPTAKFTYYWLVWWFWVSIFALLSEGRCCVVGYRLALSTRRSCSFLATIRQYRSPFVSKTNEQKGLESSCKSVFNPVSALLKTTEFPFVLRNYTTLLVLWRVLSSLCWLSRTAFFLSHHFKDSTMEVCRPFFLLICMLGYL